MFLYALLYAHLALFYALLHACDDASSFSLGMPLGMRSPS